MKRVKACRRRYGDRGWQPDVTQNPLWLFSDRPRPLRDALHVEARDPLHVAGREAVQVERQAQRPTLRREGAVHPHIIVAHRNMTRDREGVFLSVANRVSHLVNLIGGARNPRLAGLILFADRRFAIAASHLSSSPAPSHFPD